MRPLHFCGTRTAWCTSAHERDAYRRQGMQFAPVSPLLPQDGVPSLARDASRRS